MSKTIIIVGGGASGVLLASHILRKSAPKIKVTLIERGDQLGRGPAFNTVQPDHILNVSVSNMSAFADEPSHFWNWLSSNGYVGNVGCSDPSGFVPRWLYANYLQDLLKEYFYVHDRIRSLDVVHGDCVSISKTSKGVEVKLAEHSRHKGDIIVLATGPELPVSKFGGSLLDPWKTTNLPSVHPNAPILILGSGLSMVDFSLSLVAAGHRGPIIALSRHGLLPRVHRATKPLYVDAKDIPFEAELSELCAWLRTLARKQVHDGGDWRGVVDALRPFTQELWQKLSLDRKRRFLRHARSWWDVHRHRMAPEIHYKLEALIASGRVRVLAGKLLSLCQMQDYVRVTLRRRFDTREEQIEVARVSDCRGISTDPNLSENPFIQDLLKSGLCRSDALGLGFDVTSECALIDANGNPSQQVFAVGALTRAVFWEIVAIPDIRVQCEMLASRIESLLEDK